MNSLGPRLLLSNTLWDHWRVYFLKNKGFGHILVSIYKLQILIKNPLDRFIIYWFIPIPTLTDFWTWKNTDIDYRSSPTTGRLKKWTVFIRWCGPPRLHLSMHIPLVLNAEPFLCDSRGLRLLLLLNKIGTNINKVIIGMIWTSPNSARLVSKIPDWPGYLRNC